MSHLKCGKTEGRTVWAPGLLGTIAIRGLKVGAETDWGEPGCGATAEEARGGRDLPEHRAGQVEV